ncbi:NADPH quinone oxidoreductase [Bordetella ansorpii]|uniref:NADPH quinone oxidoreductase n=1 Tax=Bordetella ansorpii TaxID=288768 RepID=A0A157NRD8_9BORD|nr:NADP-dependent oxidoreductase [Bordetella ansorpii]SAI23660.1 NADPH quinone oxidoreductase [Bordetella ansorpii]
MNRMHAFRIDSFGGPEVLHRERVPIPSPRSEHILVKVAAASLNPVDVKTRSGRFPLVKETQLPFTLGRDCAGVVQESEDTHGPFRPGQEVFAFVGHGQGAYAEFALVPREALAPKPQSLDLVEAAAVPLAALTAWQGLFEHGRLEPGQTVLIHAASGGVGHFAVQFAKARGAQVIATASGEAGEFVRSLGADMVIDYRKEAFERQTPPVDLVFDLVGGETQERSWAVLKDGGAFVSTVAEPSADKAAARRIRAIRYTAQPDGAELALIGRLIDSGRIRVHVSEVYPFDAMEQALHRLEEGHNRGKMVVRL